METSGTGQALSTLWRTWLLTACEPRDAEPRVFRRGWRPSRVRLSSLLWDQEAHLLPHPGPYGHTGHTQQSALSRDRASCRSGQPGTWPPSPSAVLGGAGRWQPHPSRVEMQKKQEVTFPKRRKHTQY